MINFRKLALFQLLVAVFLTGCGGSGGSGGSEPDDAPVLGSDASLSSLSLSSGALNETFSSSVYSYTQTTSAENLTVTTTLSDVDASLTVNGVAVASGSVSSQIDLVVGANTVTVVVTAENGSTSQTYEITITRLSNDASLSALILSAGAIAPAFTTDKTDYALTTVLASTTVSATITDTDATVTINGDAAISGAASPPINLAVGDNTMTIIVTAEDGITSQTYTVTITRLSDDASLSGLSLSAGDLEQIFQPSLNRYTAGVSFWTVTVMVIATTGSSDATLTINGVATNSAEASDSIGLNEGRNIVTVVVTAEDGVTTQTYTVEITRQGAEAFAQQAYVKASNTDAGDGFGHSVALSGDTMAVGAELEDGAATGINGDETDNGALNAGAVYVFIRDGAGVWSQQAYIKASNTGVGDYFGWSVALSGDTLAVGAYNEDSAATGINGAQADNSATDSGAVYVFTRDGAGIWSQQAYIKASNTAATARDSNFGYAVDLSGDTLAVGARNESSSAFHSGAVYMFTRDALGEWSQQAFLKASNAGASDWFGWSISLDGDTLVAGAPYEQSAATGIDGGQADNSASHSGAVYVFTRDEAGTWSQQAYVKASNTDWGDIFGVSVSLSGDTFVVGAAEERSAATGVGGNQSDNSLSWPGAVYVFTRDGLGTWSQQAYLKASNSGAGDRFGWSVALSGNTLAVAAYGEGSAATGINGDQMDNSAEQSGAVYMFTRDSLGVWSQQAYVKASNTSTSNTPDNDFFGRWVTMDADTLAVGAKREDSAASGIDGEQADNGAPEAGAVYMFR